MIKINWHDVHDALVPQINLAAFALFIIMVVPELVG